MNKKLLYELTDYEKIVLNINKLGDLLVMGIILIENEETNSNVQLTESTVRNALNLLQKRHPFFHAYIDENSNLQINEQDYNLIELEWFDQDQLQPNRSEMLTQLELFNAKPFDFKAYSNLVRCKVVRYLENESSNKIMYSISLSIASIITDGINVTAITIELVNIINALLSQTECSEMKTCLEPVESLHYYVEKYKLFGEKQKNNLLEKQKEQEVEFLLDKEFRQFNETGFKLDCFKVDKQTTSKIMQKAKENKIRLTGYLNTAVLYALRDLYNEYNLKLPEILTSSHAVNLRFRYEPSMEYYHLRYQVLLTNEIQIKRDDLTNEIWSDSQIIHEKIVETTDLNSGNAFVVSHNEDILGAYLESFKNENVLNEMHKEMHGDLAISNIGAYVWNKRMVYDLGPFKIKETYFSDSLQTVPHIIPGLVFHIGYWNEEIMIQLSSNKYAIGAIFVNKLLDLLAEQFKNSF
jgi:hypothetical protein